MKHLRSIYLVLLILLLAACGQIVTTPTPESQPTLESQASLWTQLGTNVATSSNLATTATNGTTVATALTTWNPANVFEASLFVKRWDGTAWTQLGGKLNVNRSTEHNIAMPADGNPIVAFSEFTSAALPTTNIYVKRWNGTAWIQLGSQLDNFVDTNANAATIALDSSGNPVVAWSENNGSPGRHPDYDLYVKRWNGTTWVQLGGFLDVAAGHSPIAPAIALDGSGNPFVTWYESNEQAWKLYVKRWTGTAWTLVGPGPLNIGDDIGDPFSNAVDPSIVIDKSGNPIVAWSEGFVYAKRWTGTAWVLLASTPFGNLNVDPNQTSHNPHIGIDSSGSPIATWEEQQKIYVKRWTGTAWVFVGANPLSSPLNAGFTNPAGFPSLSFVNGDLVVAWHEGTGPLQSTVYTKRFVTNVWTPVGRALDTTLSNSATNSSIGRKSDNRPIVAWDEQVGTSRNVYVKERIGSNWVALAGALDISVANPAVNPSLAVRGDNRPVVAFQEANDIYVRQWDGTNWLTVGAALDNVLANPSLAPSLALEPLTPFTPVVAFAENNDIIVKRWTGTAWAQLGTALDTILTNTALNPSLALDSTNNPVVAWQEQVGTSLNVVVKRWDGAAWVAVGAALDTTLAQQAENPVLALRTDNNPVVAWQEAGNIYVKRWDGVNWLALGAALDISLAREAINPALDLRTDNNPVVSWQESDGTSYNVYTKRWGGSWIAVGGALDTNVARDAKRPTLILGSTNVPIVSWDEWDGTSENIYVKQF